MSHLTINEPNVIDNINAQITAGKASSSEPYDPETGEVISPKGEVKPTEPKPQALPTFDINKHATQLNTPHGAKAAAAEFIAVLTAYPQEERGAVFLQSSGIMLVEAIRAHRLSLEEKQIQALGINLPPAEDEVEKTPTFIGKRAQPHDHPAPPPHPDIRKDRGFSIP